MPNDDIGSKQDIEISSKPSKTPKVSESERLFHITQYEREYWEQGLSVAGMDEVGRGPLAGPVAVACVIMPPSPLISYVNDSKKVSEAKRTQLYPELIRTAIDYSVKFVKPQTIDRMNILVATRSAFRNAFCDMKITPDVVLADYITNLDISAENHALVHGDALSYSIAAASIIAKVERDNYMVKMDKLYPQYGFARNKGYGTAEHLAALRRYGPCPIHRRTFIKNLNLLDDHNVTGAFGEKIAADYLRRRGYVLIDSNCKVGHYEIDLIMRDGRTIVFVEVKTRANMLPGDGLAAINSRKRYNITRAARGFLEERGIVTGKIRFDEIEVDSSTNRVTHIIDAFNKNGKIVRKTPISRTTFHN